MAERRWPPTEAELERALVDLGARVAYPPTPRLAESVRTRLLADTRPVRPTAWGPIHGLRRALSLALLALALLAGAVLALSPGTRTAMAQWLRLHGIVLFYAPSVRVPAPTGTHLGLGRRLTLAAAQAHVPYHILKPGIRSLGAPDEVYVRRLVAGDQVALVYRARRGLPRAKATGVGLLLAEVPGSSPVAGKFVEPGTRVYVVTVNGLQGYWITGKPHLFGYIDDKGVFRMETARLAGNVLLWERDGLVLRLESALPEAAALRIAASVR
jgi:hypothetical protein